MASEPTPFIPDAYEHGEPGKPVPDELLHTKLSRRRMLQAFGALGGAAVVAGGVTAGVAAQSAKADPYVLPTGFTGTMADLKHVVIFMQENRSTDHYYGSLKGVRGFDDKQTLIFQNGKTVFEQPNGTGVLEPYRVTDVASLSAGSLDHGYTNMPNWNNWPATKGASTMRYFTGEELPFQYSLASQYTFCDMNFCSLHGPTTPNRLYLWSGNSNGRTGNGGESSDSGWKWRTVPETLQAANISWRIYVDNTNNGSSWVGDYTDNPIRGFTAISGAGNTGDQSVGGIRWKAGANPYAATGAANNDGNRDAVLKDFIAACQAGAEHPLPEVSWIVAPYAWSEHPQATPEHGAHFLSGILEALQSNEEIWNSTLVICTFDENDGIWDHVLPPRPETTVPAEGGSSPYGPGPRVPMLLISPWTRGGYVASEVFDHTSVTRFLETWSGYMVANDLNGHGTDPVAFHGVQTSVANDKVTGSGITAWRRSVMGDLTSAIDFAHPVAGVPDLPDTSALIYIADHASGAIAAQVNPDDWFDESFTMTPRPLYFHPHGEFIEDRVKGTVTANLSVYSARPADAHNGPKAISFSTFEDRYRTFDNVPHTVYAGTPFAHTVDVTTTDGKYAFSVYGPDGFIRSHQGVVVQAGRTNGGLPAASLELTPGASPTATFTLRNEGHQPVRYVMTANDHLGGTQHHTVQPGATKAIAWPLDDHGRYDVVLTAGAGWRHRYAGRIAMATA